jgi:hypothetical protein
MSRAAKVSSAIGGAVLVVVLVVALAIASVDGGDDAASSDSGDQSEQQFPGAGPPSGADREALRGFQECLEEQGVELPEPGSQRGGPPSGFDPSDPDLQEALSACQDALPEGVGPR